MHGTEARQFLKNHPWVSNVSVTGSGAGEQRLLADISPDGHREIRVRGFEEFSKRLTAALPPEGRPGDSLQFRHVHGWMLHARPMAVKNGYPGILSWLSEADVHRVLLEVGEQVVYFEGHFPGNPILPGIAQVHWAASVAMSLFEFREVPYEIKRLKFRSIIRPSSVVELVLERKSSLETVFEFSSSGQVHSSGCLCFKEEMPC